jgi:hypothetical protein
LNGSQEKEETTMPPSASGGGGGAAAGAAAAAAIANAIKASGVLVRLEPDEFQKIARRVERPLVIYSQGWFFAKKHRYLISYKGFAFFTKSVEPLDLPSGAELVTAQKIWIPG